MSGKAMKIREGTIIKESNTSSASHCQSANLCNSQHQSKVNCCKGDMEELKSQLDREKQKRFVLHFGQLKKTLLTSHLCGWP